MRDYVFPDGAFEKSDNSVTYLCPFCPVEQGIPGKLTISLDSGNSRVTLTECTKGFANCCSIAELLAGIVVIFGLNKLGD